MKKIISVLVVMMVFMGMQALAADMATKQECMDKCKAASDLVQKVGLDEALVTLNDKNGPFVWKDTYVFCVDMDRATVLAHPIKPVLIGKDLIGMKDANGKMFFVEFIETAKNDQQGWVEYMWPKPGEDTSSPKDTYVYRVPGRDILVAAGIYK
ncbi:MAG: cache domain-containing protein [Thermodesulfobacteriota bacterium]|nr:cache domain-containing protein [Thermodesulfobacteriota bacterium]